jgi:hypothetical protein
MNKIKENLGPFFVLWGIIIFLNQFLLFHGCFNLACIVAALPHTGVIALVLLPFLFKNEKITQKNHLQETSKNYNIEQYHSDSKKIDPLKKMGDDYEKNIGKSFESKGDFVIYNGLIRGFADGGVDLIVISPNSQSINFVQCKNWQNMQMEYHHINSVYDKLNEYLFNINISGVLSIYFFKYSKEIQKNLSYKKEYNEIANIFKSAYKYSNIRKTLYISTDKVLDPDINQYIKMIKPNIFRYKDMKIVISKI